MKNKGNKGMSTPKQKLIHNPIPTYLFLVCLCIHIFWSMLKALVCAPGDAYKKLFDSLVAPVLDYCSPVWSHSLPHSSLERLQHHAYRCFLGVGRKHALAAAAGDMCWMPTVEGTNCNCCSHG